MFHSAQWNHTYDMSGKRIGVIGNAASGLQLIPKVAETAAHLTVFQRSPNWVFPRNDRAYRDTEKRRFRRFSLVHRWYRYKIYWSWERSWPWFLKGSNAAHKKERVDSEWIASQVADTDLAASLTPDYEIGCKRILLADDYYPALLRENVRLNTAPIERIIPSGIVSGGREIPLDCIVLATGFKARDL